MRIRFFYIACMWLTILLGWSGCVEPVEEILYAPGEVKTEISMVIPEVHDQQGRMTESDVQVTPGSFRGMRDIRLYPFEIKGEHLVKNGQPFVNFNILSASNMEVNALNKKMVWYDDVEVAPGTNTFLMYGRGDHPALSAALEPYAPFLYGRTKTSFENVDLSANVSVLKFTPATILSKQKLMDEDDPYFNWALLHLKGVVETQTATNPTEDQLWATTTYAPLRQLYDGLVMTESNGGTMSASSKSMLAIYEDLYNNLSRVKVMANSAGNATAEALAQKVMENIVKPFSATYGSKQVDINIATSSKGNTMVDGVTYETFALNFSGSGDNLPNFPLRFLVPDGAILFKITPEIGKPATVVYEHKEHLAAGTTGVWDVYAYPAELFYFANTGIKTANASMKNDYESNNYKWEDFIKKFIANYVSPTTKSIVLEKPVEYGVGNLVTKVSLREGLLDDYRTNSENPKVDFSQGMLWTGLMISDQREVGWNFTREAQGLTDRSYILYDSKLNGATVQPSGTEGVVVKAGNAVTNYTLVYPTKVVTPPYKAENTDRVSLILEFENGDHDFHGQGDCLIPAHTRFYITALLDLSKISITGPMEGNADRHQIFESDYKTKVSLVVENLKNATNSVPDLRTVNTDMGIGVKVSWEEGFDFRVTVNDK